MGLPSTTTRASRRLLSRAIREPTPLQAPLMMMLSTASMELTASTLGAAATPCALAAALTRATGDMARTISWRWMGARTTSPVALVLIGSKLTPGTTWQRGVRKSLGLAKGSSRLTGVLRASPIEAFSKPLRWGLSKVQRSDPVGGSLALLYRTLSGIGQRRSQ